MFSKTPPALQITIQIIALGLVIYSFSFLSETATKGQKFHSETSPVLKQIIDDARGDFPSKVTITEEQFSTLAIANHRHSPPSTPDASLIRFLAVLGIILLSLFPMKKFSKDKNIFPND